MKQREGSVAWNKIEFVHEFGTDVSRSLTPLVEMQQGEEEKETKYWHANQHTLPERLRCD